MKKDTLIKHLENTPLVVASKEKQYIDCCEKKLRDTIETLRLVDADDETVEAVTLKLKEYQKISAGYDKMIETVWGLSCWDQAIVDRFINCDFVELQELPSEIK